MPFCSFPSQWGNFQYILFNRNIREIYAHAYQSYLWNKLASRRIQRYGKQPAIGDLVLARGDVKEEDVCDEEEQDVIIFDEKQEQNTIENSEVIMLTEVNVNGFEAKHIVLPIYGSKTVIPQDSIITQLLQEIFLEEGITAQDFDKAQKNFFLDGGYRYLIQIPENFDHEIIYFNDREQELVSPFYQVEKMKIPAEGKYMAVLIQMDLRKSCYATMLIRELSKQSTSLEQQQKLNELYRQL